MKSSHSINWHGPAQAHRQALHTQTTRHIDQPYGRVLLLNHCVAGVRFENNIKCRKNKKLKNPAELVYVRSSALPIVVCVCVLARSL